MPSTLLMRLRAELSRLEEERDEIDDERDEIDDEIESFRRVIAYYEEHGEGAARSESAQAVRDAIEVILEQAGQPLHFRMIYRKLAEQGIHLPGLNPEKNVGSHLSADHRFVPMGKGYWALKPNLDADVGPRESTAA